MLTSDDCGFLFDTSYDVQKHLKQGWCPANSVPPAKRMNFSLGELKRKPFA